MEYSKCYSYANSALILLFHSSSFSEWLREKFEHHKECPRIQYCVLCQLLTAWKNYSISRIIDNLPLLLALKKSEWKDLNLLQPQKVSKFIKILLNHLNLHYGLTDFQFEIVKENDCTICGNRVNTKDLITSSSLSVNYVGSSSLLNAIDWKVNGAMQFERIKCVQCQQYCIHDLHEKFSKLPRVLLICATDCCIDEQNKVMTYTEEDTIKLEHYCTKEAKNREQSFFLKGLIYLHEESCSSNYSVLYRNETNGFEKYENGYVSAVQNQDVLPTTPVVALYDICSVNPYDYQESRSISFRVNEVKKRTHVGEIVKKDTTTGVEEMLAIGRNLAYPKTQKAAFLTYDQLQQLYDSNQIPFPYKDYHYVDDEILKNDPNSNIFILEEFEETVFPFCGSKTFFDKRRFYLNRFSLLLLGGLFVCLNDNTKLFLKHLRERPKGTKKSKNYDKSHCKLCSINFKDYEGIYLHLIRNHTPTQYLMKEELICLGINHDSSTDWILKRNQQLLAIIHIQTVALKEKLKIGWENVNKYIGLNSFIYKCELDKLQQALVHQYGKNQNMLLTIPDNMLLFVDPRPWKFDINRLTADEKKILFQKMSKSMHHFFVQKKEEHRRCHKIYVIALVDQDTNQQIQFNYNGDIGKFMTSKNKEELSSPIVLYAGKVSMSACYSSHHFKHDKGSIVTSYWRTGEYYPWLLSTEICNFDPASDLSTEEQLIAAELKKILTLKIWSTIQFKSKHFRCVAPQQCHAVDVRRYIQRDWLYKCVEFCKSTNEIFSYNPTSEFEVKLFGCHQITGLFEPKKQPANEKIPEKDYCYMCDLLLPSSRIAENHLELHRKGIRRNFGDNLDSLLSSLKLLTKEPSKYIVSAIHELCSDVNMPTENPTGLYLIVIDMLETSTLEFQDLEMELKKFIETGLDTQNRTQRFLFYIGKNAQGGFPSSYHKKDSFRSSIKKINRPAYCIKGWYKKGAEEDICLMVLFIKKCLQRRDHINFINCHWNMTKNADKFSVKCLQQLLIAVDDNHKIFCTVDHCNKIHEDVCFFSSIHINASEFKILQTFEPKKKTTTVDNINVTGFLSFLNSHNILNSKQRKNDTKIKDKIPFAELIHHQDWVLQVSKGFKKKRRSLEKIISKIDAASLTYPYMQPSHLLKVEPCVRSKEGFLCLFCRFVFDQENQILLHLPSCMTSHFERSTRDNSSFYPFIETSIQAYTVPLYETLYTSPDNQDRSSYSFHDIPELRFCKICNVLLKSTTSAAKHFCVRHKDLLGEKKCFYCFGKYEADNKKWVHQANIHFGTYYKKGYFRKIKFSSSSSSE